MDKIKITVGLYARRGYTRPVATLYPAFVTLTVSVKSRWLAVLAVLLRDCEAGGGVGRKRGRARAVRNWEKAAEKSAASQIDEGFPGARLLIGRQAQVGMPCEADEADARGALGGN